tara:strand:+ start:99 stop:320 length:222 start_codon:yes stop_codon:yes gene_type:complete
MKNIKEITLSVLIIISFYTLLTSILKDEPNKQEVWEIKAVRMANDLGVLYSINKVTGEVRLHLPEDGKIKTIK